MMLQEARMGSAPDDGFNMDIEPDDIDVTDTVTVVWEIDWCNPVEPPAWYTDQTWETYGKKELHLFNLKEFDRN